VEFGLSVLFFYNDKILFVFILKKVRSTILSLYEKGRIVTEIRRSLYIRFLVHIELFCPSLSWMVFESIIGCVLEKPKGNLYDI